MSVKERIKYFSKSKGISIREFERLSGLNYGYVNAIRVSIQPDKIEGIASCFPDLNIEWLLTGDGEMSKTNNNNTIDAAKAYYIQAHLVNNYISKLGTPDNQVKVATLTIPHLVSRDNYFFAFDVIDDRLSKGIEPALNINDIVIAEVSLSREVPFFKALISNPVIVVILSDKYGQLIRKVTDARNDEVILSPTHNLYIHDEKEDISIKIKDIKMLAIVKKIIVNDPIFKID